MALPEITTMAGPPEVGKFYMVPAIYMQRYFRGPELWWPVMGPLHTDADFFNFRAPHYHVDPRFLNARHLRYTSTAILSDDPIEVQLATPVSKRYGVNSTSEAPPPPPVLRRMKCQRLGVSYPYGDTKQVTALNTHHRGDHVRTNAEGHMICPHRGARIDQLPPGENGVVVCPLHGLRINVRTGKCGG